MTPRSDFHLPTAGASTTSRPSGPGPAPRRDRRPGEEGSAYLVVLLLLVVLTILGLSLSVITQTEVLIGGSEKQSTRQLYAASSGVHVAAVRELVSRSSQAYEFPLMQKSTTLFGGSNVIGDKVCTTPFLIVHSGTCNLCMMNQDAGYYAVQYGVTAAALRFGDSELGARRMVSTVLAFEPYTRSLDAAGQLAGEKPLREPGTLAADSTTEIDCFEDLYLRI